MAMALPILFLMQMISYWGIGSALVQHKDLNETKISQLFGFIILVFSCAVLIIMLSAPLVASFFHEERLIPILRVLSLNFIFMSLYLIPDSLLFREMDFHTKTQADISSRLVAAAVAIICAFNSLGVWSLIFAECCMHITKAIHLNVVYPKRYRPIFRFDECRELINFGMLVSGTVFFIYLFTQADKIIVGKYLGKELLGVYAVALNLALLPKEKILPIITQISFSAYSKIQEDTSRIRSSLLLTIEIIALVAFPLFWGMATIADKAIPLILGPHWKQAALPFELLCIVIPLLTISPLYPSALNAIGKTRVVFSNSVIEASLVVVAMLIGVRYSLLGVSLSWIIFYSAAFIIVSRRSLNSLNIGMNELFARLSFPFCASLVMAMSVILFKRLLVDYMNSVSLLSLSIITGAFIYGMFVMIYKKEKIISLKNMYNARKVTPDSAS